MWSSKMWVASETSPHCSLGATASKRQVAFLTRLVWTKAGNIKHQEIAMWGQCVWPYLQELWKCSQRVLCPFCAENLPHIWVGCRTVILSLALSVNYELGEQLCFMLSSRIHSLFLLEQHICAHPLKRGWAVLPLPMAVHFPAYWQLLFLFLFYIENGTAFHFPHGKGTFFCLKTHFRFWKTTKGDRRSQKG